ncbi:hypothetical protein MAR_033126, partial [Mya arenaria]
CPMETQNNEMLLKDVPEFGNEIRKEFMLRKNSDVITTYTKQLREKCVEYLEDLWETSRLPVPESMVAPNLQMVQLPYIPKFSERPDMYGDLQKLILDQFDIQTYIHTVNGQLYARVSTQIYNTFDDYVKLGNAILNIAREE